MAAVVNRSGVWPIHLPPPGAPQWQRHAVNWLLDLCPAEYRSYRVLTRHPLALAHLARSHVLAQLKASEQSCATLRARVGERFDAHIVEEVLAAVHQERTRLHDALLSIDAIGVALAQP